MFDAWLNYNTTDLHQRALMQRVTHAVLMSTDDPVVATAVQELARAVPSLPVLRLAAGAASQQGARLAKEAPASALVIGTCGDAIVRQALAAGAGVGASSPCHPGSPLASGGAPEAYSVRRLPGARGGVLLVGGGPAGILYGVFGLVRGLQTGAGWADTTEQPSTSVRLLNHWSQWRGLPQDAWSFVQGRADSIFSWEDLRRGGNATFRIRGWARLLASVGVNAIAPQDVNYHERNNYLNHLAELPALAAILRGYVPTC